LAQAQVAQAFAQYSLRSELARAFLSKAQQ